MGLRERQIRTIIVNGRIFNKVFIDTHVFKHSHMDEDKIVSLVLKLDGSETRPEQRIKSFEYFKSHIALDGKSYRLIWLLEDDQDYVGVRTAFRETRRGD